MGAAGCWVLVVFGTWAFALNLCAAGSTANRVGDGHRPGFITRANSILIVGAMATSPDLWPMCAICIGMVTGRRRLAGRAFAALIIGLAAAGFAAYLITVPLRWAGYGPTTGDLADGGLGILPTVNVVTVVVAFVAGIAGILTFETRSSSAGGVDSRDGICGGRPGRSRGECRDAGDRWHDHLTDATPSALTEPLPAGEAPAGPKRSRGPARRATPPSAAGRISTGPSRVDHRRWRPP